MCKFCDLGEQMKIKTHSLWRHIGRTIHIKDSTNEYVPNGVYLILGRESDGCIEIGDLITRETTIIEEYTETDEVILISHEINIDELAEFKLASCVSLIRDGYEIGGGMDLTPYLSDYLSYTKLQKIKGA